MDDANPSRGEVQPSFWKGKRVLLLGHTGFKGSWASLWMQQMGAEVVGFALQPPTDPALFDVAAVAHGMISIIDDIRDGEAVARAVIETEPEIVIHMAAQALVRPSYADPVGTYATNVMGTVHVLEAVRSAPSVRVVLSVTTDKCYENREWLWGYRETEPMGGHDPYSSSKACAELVGNAYRSSFFADSRVALASARAGNVVGGGDWATDRLVPDALRALERKEPVRVRNPLAVRPWQHVLEPLSGYLVLCQALWEHGQDYAEGWNFGPNDLDARPVRWVIRHLTSRWGGESCWEHGVGGQPHEAHYLKLDISKAAERLSWHPRWRLGEALDRTVRWHHKWLVGADMREHSLVEIANYMSSRGDSIDIEYSQAQTVD